MRRNRAKEAFAWPALARQSAERGGFRPSPYPMAVETFCRAGDVSPIVQVFFQRVTFAETAPEALLGIDVEPFEREWRDRLSRTDLAPAFESPSFGLHVANGRI